VLSLLSISLKNISNIYIYLNVYDGRVNSLIMHICLNQNGQSALEIAAGVNNFEVVKLLVNNGAKNDDDDDEEEEEDEEDQNPTPRQTALMIACHTGNLEMVQFLVLNGADIRRQNQVFISFSTFSKNKTLV
jgi:ankyrin repeat protein